MGRTWRKCACQAEHRQTGHLANSERWGQCTTKSVSFRKLILKEIRLSSLGSWCKHLYHPLHASWKKPMSLVRQAPSSPPDPPHCIPLKTCCSGCCGCWYVSWLTEPVFNMWSICLHVMHVIKMSKRLKNRKCGCLFSKADVTRASACVRHVVLITELWWL